MKNLVFSRNEYENLGKDRYCLNLLDVLSRLFEVPLAAIFENESLCEYFNQEEIIQDQLRLLQDCSSLDQARLEQKTYIETVSKGLSVSLLNNFVHQIYPLLVLFKAQIISERNASGLNFPKKQQIVLRISALVSKMSQIKNLRHFIILIRGCLIQ